MVPTSCWIEHSGTADANPERNYERRPALLRPSRGRRRSDPDDQGVALLRRSGAEAGVLQGQPLRIGFRISQFPKLSETFVLSQVLGLAGRGHQVVVLADELGADAAPCATGAVQVRALTPRQARLAQAYNRMPYRLRQRRIATAERRLCEDNDVVICNFGWTGQKLVDSLGEQPSGARLITIFHGNDMSSTVRQGPPDLYEALFRRADLLLTVSDYWRKRLLELGAPPGKLRVHRMGVDLRRFPFVARRPDPAPFRLAAVGRLVEKKGMEFALRALAQVRRTSPQQAFRLIVIGDGPLRGNLEALRQDLDLADQVHFLGAQPHARVAEVLNGSDAFILPSITATDGDMEGIPVSLMEAMASGLPVISSRHSGIPELIEDGVSGLLAAEGDVDGLARQLLRTMTRSDERAALAQAARRRIEAEFDEAVLNERLDRMVRELAAADGPIGATPRFAPQAGAF